MFQAPLFGFRTENVMPARPILNSSIEVLLSAFAMRKSMQGKICVSVGLDSLRVHRAIQKAAEMELLCEVDSLMKH